MRKMTGPAAWGVVALLALAMGTLPLAACSSTDEAVEHAAEGQDAGVEDATGQEVASDEVVAEEPAAEETVTQYEPVWVKTSETNHQESDDGNPYDYEATYKLDEAGNVVSETFVQGDSTYLTSSDYDEHGWSVVERTGEDTITFDNEYDERGLLTRRTDSDGNTAAYEYDEEGRLVQTTYVSQAYDVDENMQKIEGSEFESTTVVSFDEDGMVTSRVTSNKNGTSAMTYDYEYDEDGVLARYTRTESYTDAEGTTWDDTQSTARITCDENGNVIELITENTWGTATRTFTYTLVEHPSPAVSVNSRIKSF